MPCKRQNKSETIAFLGIQVVPVVMFYIINIFFIQSSKLRRNKPWESLFRFKDIKYHFSNYLCKNYDDSIWQTSVYLKMIGLVIVCFSNRSYVLWVLYKIVNKFDNWKIQIFFLWFTILYIILLPIFTSMFLRIIWNIKRLRIQNTSIFV